MITAETVKLIFIFLLAGWPKNPANKRIDEYSKQIVEYSEKYEIDPILLITIGWHESGFRSNVVSKKGAIGIYQTRGYHRRLCKAANLSPSGIECGALCIKTDIGVCGSVQAAMHRFLTGRCRGNKRSKYVVKRRLKTYQKIKSQNFKRKKNDN